MRQKFFAKTVTNMATGKTQKAETTLQRGQGGQRP
jgi:hypothetical protein